MEKSLVRCALWIVCALYPPVGAATGRIAFDPCPAKPCALEAAMGTGAAERLAADVTANMKAFNAMAERLYINWMQTSAQV